MVESFKVAETFRVEETFWVVETFWVAETLWVAESFWLARKAAAVATQILSIYREIRDNGMSKIVLASQNQMISCRENHNFC